ATLAVAATIPVSLLGAVAIAYFAGFTVNMILMLALLLLVGVVVDDAIVVIENIHRWREQGLAADTVSAALHGARQVSFAVVAATLTLVSIFAPAIFMSGMVARFFQTFSVTVTFGVLVSLIVALTLIPMLAAHHLHYEEPSGRLYAAFGRAHAAMDRAYRRVLAWALRFPWRVLGAAGLLFVASFAVFAAIGKGFVPNEDEGRFLVRFKLPVGASLAATEAKLDEIEATLREIPEVRHLFSAVGLGARGKVNEGVVFVQLVDKSERDRPQWEIRKEAQRRVGAIPGVQAIASRPPIVGGMRSEPLQFAVVGPDLARTESVAQRLAKRLRAHPEIG
ncbi:MAG: efflux RND transporter permease subunit, partial [Zetaproteobacteria bacterium]